MKGQQQMKPIRKLTETETRLGFATLCVEATAKKAGCSYREMYERLHKVGLIQELAAHEDPLHTQSRDYVTDEILKALTRLETQQKTK
jgi:hypothetical protein